MSTQANNSWKLWLIVWIVIPCLVVALIETFGYLYVYYQYGVPGKSYGLWNPHPVLGAILAPNRYNTTSQTNNAGFRAESDLLEERPADSLRIIAYGGSTTFGYNLPTHDTWVAGLERSLRELQGNTFDQVLNAGDIMWSVSHIAYRVKNDFEAFKPDIAILYTGINEGFSDTLMAEAGIDLKSLVENEQYGVPNPNLAQSSMLWRRSFTYKLLHKKVLEPFQQWYFQKLIESGRGAEVKRVGVQELGSEKTTSYIYKNYLEVLKGLIADLRRHGVVPVFVIQAHSREVLGDSPSVTLYSRKVAPYLKSIGVRVVDSQIAIDRYSGNDSELFAPSGVHFNASGSKVFSKYLLEELGGELMELRHDSKSST